MKSLHDNVFYNNLINTSYKNNQIEPQLYSKYNVKSGLRNENGTGVIVGLTNISYVLGYEMVENIKVPVEGKLLYRGIDLKDFVAGFQKDHRRGFEECIYLLLFGVLPSYEELKQFNDLLDKYRDLPYGFTENMILKIPSKDIMNKLQRSILVLYSHDEKPDDTRICNVLEQCIKLIARFPTIISYGYQALAHYFDKKSLFIHSPQKEIGTAENILYLTRSDSKYTEMEAEILDLCLVIHAEHGGGNNSAFATHVISSSGTDVYSAISAAVGCLKGPKHGGANIKVRDMVENIKYNVSDTKNRGLLKDYLWKIIRKEVFNKEGLIYGMGHAVYTKSDPRSVLLKEKALKLSVEKDRVDDYNLYKNIEEISLELLKEIKGDSFNICSNVDLYSGFVYDLLNIPADLYTPLFAASRISGWCAHLLEQLAGDNKIIRPAYVNTAPRTPYTPLRTRGSQYVD